MLHLRKIKHLLFQALVLVQLTLLSVGQPGILLLTLNQPSIVLAQEADITPTITPTIAIEPSPTSEPTPTTTPEPTVEPTSEPTTSPSTEPTPTATPEPEAVPNFTPSNLGFNIPNSPTDSFSTPRPDVEIACGGFTNGGNPASPRISHHWTDESADGAVQYRRQWVLPGSDPNNPASWQGAETWTTPYSNFRSFSTSAGIAGTWHVRVQARDAAGNWSEYSEACAVTLDLESPVLSITSPSSDGAICNQTLHITGTASDEVSGIAKVEVILTDADAVEFGPFAGVSTDGNWSIEIENSDLPAGTYSAVVTTTDGAGNSSSESISAISFNTQCATISACKVSTSGIPQSNWEMNLARRSLVQSFTLASNNRDGVSSTALEVGKLYQIVVSGTWLNNGTNRVVDAEYYSDNTWTSHQDMADQVGRDARQLDVVINNADVSWGAYNADHTYSTEYIGTGSPITLRVFDEDNALAGQNWYADNVGSLTVTIYELTNQASQSTDSDGCTQFAPLNPGDYILSETDQENWLRQTSDPADTVPEGGLISAAASSTQSFTFVNHPVSDLLVCKQDEAGNPLNGWEIGLGQPILETYPVTTSLVKSSTAVDGPTLPAGQYRVEVEGTYHFWNVAGAGIADAGYSLRPANSPFSYHSNPHPTWVSGDDIPMGGTNNGWLELWINGTNQDWGPYMSDHRYSIMVDHPGGAMTFFFKDNSYGDNYVAASGMTIRVFAPDEQTGITQDATVGDAETVYPGCVVFEDIELGNYTIREVAQPDYHFVTTCSGVPVAGTCGDGLTIVNGQIIVDSGLEQFVFVNQLNPTPTPSVTATPTPTVELTATPSPTLEPTQTPTPTAQPPQVQMRASARTGMDGAGLYPFQLQMTAADSSYTATYINPTTFAEIIRDGWRNSTTPSGLRWYQNFSSLGLSFEPDFDGDEIYYQWLSSSATCPAIGHESYQLYSTDLASDLNSMANQPWQLCYYGSNLGTPESSAHSVILNKDNSLPLIDLAAVTLEGWTYASGTTYPVLDGRLDLSMRANDVESGLARGRVIVYPTTSCSGSGFVSSLDDSVFPAGIENTYNFSVDVSSFSAGDHCVNFRVRDRAGNIRNHRSMISIPEVTPTPTEGVEPTMTVTPTPTTSPTLTPTTEPTVEPTSTPSIAPTATPTDSAEPTMTVTPTPTVSAEPTMTVTPTPTEDAEPTMTVTPTVTMEPTATVTPTSTELPTPTPTLQPTAAPLSSTSSSTSSDSSGSSGGSDASPTMCSADKPSSAPGSLRITSTGPNTISLAWDAVTPTTHYALIFTRNSDGAAYGASNIGNVTSYTITNIGSGEAYTFEVFAVNDCQPGDRSSVTSAVITGQLTEGRPLGPDGQVLGVETDVESEQLEASELSKDDSSETTSNPAVLGAQISCEDNRANLPWLLFVIQIIALLLSEYLLKKRAAWLKLLAGLVIALFTSIGFAQFKACQCYADANLLAALCQWYWAVALALSAKSRVVHAYLPALLKKISGDD